MNQKRFFTRGAALILVLIAVLVYFQVVGAQTGPDLTREVAFTQFPSMDSASYSLEWDVLANGGEVMTSMSYRLQSTLGQNAIGPSSSASYSLHGGFWQLFNYFVYLPIILN
jgi:hypothetical protein